MQNLVAACQHTLNNHIKSFVLNFISLFDFAPLNKLHIVKDVGMRNEASPEFVRPVVRPVIHLSIRPIMVCLLRRGGENSGVQTRRMLKPDLDSEFV
jgi:hypothetical protein